MSMKLNITVFMNAKSKRYGDYDASDNTASEYIKEQIEENISNQAQRFTGETAVKMGKRIEENASKELRKWFPTITEGFNSMFNLKSPASGMFTIAPSIYEATRGGMRMPTLTGGAKIKYTTQVFQQTTDKASGYLQWKALSASTVRRKRTQEARVDSSNTIRIRDARTFFMDLGELHDAMEGVGDGFLESRFGGIQVEVDEKMHNNKEKMSLNNILASIQIKMLPRMHPSMVPGLKSRDWSKASREMKLEKVMFDKDDVAKLRGYSKKTYRPLFQPTLAFWLIYRIPRAIQTSINRSVSGNLRAASR